MPASLNYTISYVPGTLTVTPAVLTVTAANETKAYGAVESGVDGDLQRVRQRRHGGEPDHARDRDNDRDDVERGRDAMRSLPRAVPRGLNYTISFAPGLLTVTPAVLTVTAANQTKPYGA